MNELEDDYGSLDDTHKRAHTDMHMNVSGDTDVFPTRGTYSSGSATQWRDKPSNIHDGSISYNMSCFPMYGRMAAVGNCDHFEKQFEVIYVLRNAFITL